MNDLDEARKTREELLQDTPPEVLAEAEENLRDPLLFSSILADGEALGIAGERKLVGTIYLIGVSRLLRRPLAAIVQGQSSSGKSYVIEKTCQLFPSEGVCQATDMTPQALYHMAPRRLQHCLIVAGERHRKQNDETAEGTKALRELIASGRIEKVTVYRPPGSNRPKTIHIKQEGPIAYIESTTLTKVFEEDANRCLLLTVNEQSEQTRRILTREAQRSAGILGPAQANSVIDLHHAMQRLVVSKTVIVPFADTLSKGFPDEPVEARRAFPQLLSMVEASALLHQFQREERDGAVIASPNDYQLARFLLAEPMNRVLGSKISDGTLRFWERLKKRPDDVFTAASIARELKVSDRSAREHLHVLEEFGSVEVVDSHRGRFASTWRVHHWSNPDAESRSVLPSVEEVCGVSELPAISWWFDESDVPF